MADGRMLKKVVSESKRLPKLKTDSARLLWTWILPYLDIEGRCLASPDIIKGKVVPRIKSFNETNIEEYLIDMHDIGLIILYEIDGEKYLQFRNFRELQNLRDNKEAKSKIPPPPKDVPAPVQLPDKDGNTHLQFNLSEFNSNKGKEDAIAAVALPFELPSKDQINEAADPMIIGLIEKTSKQLYDEKIFKEVYAFKNKMIKDRKNLRAILHTLVRAYLKRTFDKDGAWGYCQKTIIDESQNYNARDHQKTA